jgi:hypothetical protein
VFGAAQKKAHASQMYCADGTARAAIHSERAAQVVGQAASGLESFDGGHELTHGAGQEANQAMFAQDVSV